MKKAAAITLLLLIFLAVVPAVVSAQREDLRTVSLPFSTSASVREDYYDEYRFTAPYSGTIQVTVTPGGSTEDPDVSVYYISSSGYYSVGGSYHSAGQTDTVTFNAIAGNTYAVRVLGFYGGSDRTVQYSISIRYTSISGQPTVTPTPTPTPTPTTQTVSISIPYYTSGSVPDGGSIYYRFTASNSGTIRATLTPGDSNEDPDLYAYRVTSTGYSQITSSAHVRGETDEVTFSVSAGQTYAVRVYGFDGGEDNVVTFSLRIEWASITQPTPTPVYTRTPTPTTATPTPTPTTGGAPSETCGEPPSGVPEWAWRIVCPVMIQPVQRAIGGFWDGVLGIINTITDGIKNALSKVFSPIVQGLEKIGNTIVNIIKSVMDAIKGAIETVLFGKPSSASLIGGGGG